MLKLDVICSNSAMDKTHLLKKIRDAEIKPGAIGLVGYLRAMQPRSPLIRLMIWYLVTIEDLIGSLVYNTVFVACRKVGSMRSMTFSENLGFESRTSAETPTSASVSARMTLMSRSERTLKITMKMTFGQTTTVGKAVWHRCGSGGGIGVE